MTHNDLINEVTKQLATRFQPNPLHIKKQIESLIEVIGNRSSYAASKTLTLCCPTASVFGAMC
jgi:hypothetical protein